MLRPELIAHPKISEEFPIFTTMVNSYPELSKIMGAYPELANWKTSPTIRKTYNRFWTRFKKRAKDAMRSDHVATYGGIHNCYEKPYLDCGRSIPFQRQQPQADLNQGVEALSVQTLKANDDGRTSDDGTSEIEELQKIFHRSLAELRKVIWDYYLDSCKVDCDEAFVFDSLEGCDDRECNDLY